MSTCQPLVSLRSIGHRPGPNPNPDRWEPRRRSRSCSLSTRARARCSGTERARAPMHDAPPWPARSLHRVQGGDPIRGLGGEEAWSSISAAFFRSSFFSGPFAPRYCCCVEVSSPFKRWTSALMCSSLRRSGWDEVSANLEVARNQSPRGHAALWNRWFWPWGLPGVLGTAVQAEVLLYVRLPRDET